MVPKLTGKTTFIYRLESILKPQPCQLSTIYSMFIIILLIVQILTVDPCHNGFLNGNAKIEIDTNQLIYFYTWQARLK